MAQKFSKLGQQWLVGGPNQPWWSNLAASSWIEVICVEDIRTYHFGPALKMSKLGPKGVQKWPKLGQKFLIGGPNLPWWSKLAGSGWIDVEYV